MRTTILFVTLLAGVSGCSPPTTPDTRSPDTAAAAAPATAAPATAAPEAEPAPAAMTLLELQNKTRAARIAGDKAGWLRYGTEILRRAPDHPDLLISIARANAANDNRDEAVRLLRDAVGRGAGFDAATLPEIAQLQGDATVGAAVREVTERARRQLAPVSKADAFVVFDDANLRPEGITHDTRSNRWFVGSLNGEIWQVDAQGRATRLVTAGDGLREVLGLKVDVERRLLWAVSGVFPDLLPTGQPPKADLGLTGLHAIDLGTGRVELTCWFDERPVMHGFNDLALARNGDVYVTDSTAGTVWRLKGEAARAGGGKGERCAYQALTRDTRMTFPNGIVLTEDQRRLYVAHVEGISAVDVATGRRTQLAVPANAAVNSIDGLAWHDGDLLGVQGSPYLARVARIRLSPDGLAVQSVGAVGARVHSGLSQTTGVVVGESFYVVAGLPNVLAAPAGDATPPRPTILRLPLRLR